MKKAKCAPPNGWISTSKRKWTVFAIETSCDETSIALVQAQGGRVEVNHHEISTQIPVHARYGGVVPEVAARMHVVELLTLLDRAKIFPKLRADAIAVTRGPGLATALRVGIEAARFLSMQNRIPLIGVNHLEGHLASAWLIPENRRAWKFPILTLLVSGGHTELVMMKDFCSYRVIARTRDDAAGEAFDKTAKLMGLSYPGGPLIAKLATGGDPHAFEIPRPMLHDRSLDWSFSGLKTAVKRIWEELPETRKQESQTRADLAASIQEAIVDVLVTKTIVGIRRIQPRAVCVVGGVSANVHLQRTLAERMQWETPEVTLLQPAKGFHTDNAAMIAAAGIWRARKGLFQDWKRVDAKPEWDL